MKSTLAAGAVAATAALFYVGARTRDAIDTGVRDVARARSMDTWVASRENDVNVPASDFYAEMVKLLKEQYVEPIKDDQKLASGAVRGMIASLSDPRSIYMDKDEFRVYLDSRAGKYEGIGADFGFEMVSVMNKDNAGEAAPSPDDTQEVIATSLRVPRLTVLDVVPGGPADRAGVKAGDTVSSIDRRWVVDGAELARYRQAEKAFVDKKITFQQINAMQKALRKKTERALLPMRAMDLLYVGKTGAMDVVWKRGNAERSTHIARATSSMPDSTAPGGAMRVAFDADAASKLEQAVRGKSALMLDLRNNVNGDFEAMRKCLAVVAPKGTYGYLATGRSNAETSLAISVGNPSPPKLSLLVDRTTRGAAEIFALALSSHGRAKLVGSDTGGDRSIRQVVSLPDGSGYTLVTAEYQVKPDKHGVVAQKSTRDSISTFGSVR